MHRFINRWYDGLDVNRRTGIIDIRDGWRIHHPDLENEIGAELLVQERWKRRG
jgi:hypothetical protein